jgi:diadenosine tetraphosphatase ApaH/serine/threonine PP2A family protein phosphatase
MRLAILTDIHANREAFATVLADMAQRAIDRVVILGDVVGYGPDPAWCVDKVMALKAAGAIMVRGNHDAAAVDPDDMMNATARISLEWTRARLTTDQRAFLGAQPLTETLDNMLFVHASAHSPGDWIYMRSERSATASFRVAKERLIFCGHVHVPALMTCDRSGNVRAHQVLYGVPIPLLTSRRWLGVIGAVGQPRDGAAAAGWALLDTATNDLTFRRVAYDAATTVSKIRAEGLPESLAVRLLRGE